VKPIKILLIVLGFVVFSIALIILITRAIVSPPASWWWTLGLFFFYILIGIIVALVFLIKKVLKQKPEELKIDLNGAEAYAKNKLLYDDDNPDNFIRVDRILKRVGEPGASVTDRTPILWLIGKGSETNQKIDILINLKNTKEEILFLYDKREEFIKEVIRTFAENPAEVVETQIIPGLDDFGRPQNKIIQRKMSSSQKKEEDKTEEGKVANAF